MTSITKPDAYDPEWLATHYPVDFEAGIDEAAEDLASGAVAPFPERRSAQRFAIGMVRNAAYWAGYAEATGA